MSSIIPESKRYLALIITYFFILALNVTIWIDLLLFQLEPWPEASVDGNIILKKSLFFVQSIGHCRGFGTNFYGSLIIFFSPQLITLISMGIIKITNTKETHRGTLKHANLIFLPYLVFSGLYSITKNSKTIYGTPSTGIPEVIYGLIWIILILIVYNFISITMIWHQENTTTWWIILILFPLIVLSYFSLPRVFLIGLLILIVYNLISIILMWQQENVTIWKQGIILILFHLIVLMYFILPLIFLIGLDFAFCA